MATVEAKRAANRRYAENHPDRVAAQNAANYAKNKKKRQAYARKYRKENKAVVDAWRVKNRSKIAARKKAWRAANKHLNHQYDLKKHYGMTVAEYDAMLSLQRGVCAICHQPPAARRLHVDHEHATGRIRGLLCSQCNTALGLFRDSPKLLAAASKYLAKGKKRHEQR